MMVAPMRRWSERKPVAIAIGWMTSAAEMMPVGRRRLRIIAQNCARIARGTEPDERVRLDEVGRAALLHRHHRERDAAAAEQHRARREHDVRREVGVAADADAVARRDLEAPADVREEAGGGEHDPVLRVLELALARARRLEYTCCEIRKVACVEMRGEKREERGEERRGEPVTSCHVQTRRSLLASRRK